MRCVGAHVSVAGGVANAVANLRDVGGTCGQLFTHSPRVWRQPPIADDDAERFRAGTRRHGLGPWVVHASYLVNLATPDPALREKSIRSLQRDIEAAATLEVPYVNVHLGAHTGAGTTEGLTNAVSAIDALHLPDGVTLLIECDAGAGTKLGGSFDELAHVREASDHDLGICLDSAHAWAAGYALDSQAAVDRTIERLDDAIGLGHLACIHLNDSKHPCGSHRDEHAHIGEGAIGVEGMAAVINHPALSKVPFVLETPTEDGRSFAWNIARVRELRRD